MQCPRCQAMNMDGARFCSNCGNPFNYFVPPQPKKNSKAGWIILAALVGFCVLSSIAGSLFTRNSAPPPAASVSLVEMPASSQPESKPVSEPSKWIESNDTSPMDGTPTRVFALSAEHEIQGWLKTQTPMLFIRCKERKIDLYINLGMPANVEYGGGHTVRIRLDDKAPERQNWSQSTDNEALFAPRALDLARRIAAADRMRFEFVPFNASPQTVEFNVRGLKDRLTSLEAVCSKRK